MLRPIWDGSKLSWREGRLTDRGHGVSLPFRHVDRPSAVEGRSFVCGKERMRMYQVKDLTITHKKDLTTLVERLSLALAAGDRPASIGE